MMRSSSNRNTEHHKPVSATNRLLGAGTMAMVLLLGFLGSTIVAGPALAAHTRAHHKADRTPPRLHITTPKSGARVDGPIRIAGTTSDDSSVRRVRVRVEGLGHSKRAHGTGHWRYQLDPTQLSVGTHTVKVRATDSSGNRTTSTIDITVSDPPPPPPPPTNPIALGIWSDGRGGHTTDALEAQIGRMFNGVRYNYKFMATIPSSRGDREYDAGRTVFYNNAESQNIGSSRIQWADIAAGKYDDQLAQTVAAFKADPRWAQATPYLFSFHHEQDVASGLGKYGTPGDYKAAFRHIFDYFQAAGILWRDGGPVEMVWDVTRNSINSGTAKDYDPDLSGDGSVVGDYYDVFGLDVYDKMQSNGHLGYTNPHEAFDSAHQYALARGKQFGIFEMGVTEGAPGEKAEFFSKVPATLASYGDGGPGSVMAFMYSNVTGKQVYYPDTSASAMTAFTKMANDPIFQP